MGPGGGRSGWSSAISTRRPGCVRRSCRRNGPVAPDRPHRL